MTVYTRRVAIGNFSTAGGQLLYTHVGDQHLVLRDLIVSNEHSAAQTVSVVVQSGPTVFALLKEKTLDDQQSVHLELRQELLVGDQVFASSAAGPMTVAITGYFLDP